MLLFKHTKPIGKVFRSSQNCCLLTLTTNIQLRQISRNIQAKRAMTTNVPFHGAFITLEEHFLSLKIRNENERDAYSNFPDHIVSKMQDLGDGRIKALDDGGVGVQVLSHGPLDASLAVCSQVNDDLAQAISKNPTRLRGFATLPMSEPAAASKELARCVEKFGFVGALVENHLDGKFYDDEKYWPVFEKAQEMDVPIYIHPTFASEEMLEHYKGNYPTQIALALSAFGWGWHAETGHHILRLYAAGVFDRFPKLKIIIGHMGEMLPFQMERCIRVSQYMGKSRGLKDVWKDNIYVTTSGMFTLGPLACLLQSTTPDHVLYSVDYPFSSNETGAAFLEEIKASGLFDEQGFEGFVKGNAKKLLKIDS
jgi:predicted TIM-barrel fold metal-dependent hydrolase